MQHTTNDIIERALDCLEKIDHTVCLNTCDGNMHFGIDEYEHIDCASIEDFVMCYDTVARCLDEVAKNYFMLKEIFKGACTINSYSGYQTIEMTLNDETLKKVKEILDAE